MFRTDGLIADNGTSNEAGKKEVSRSHDRHTAASPSSSSSSSSCLSKRDQRLCLRAKQPNGSEPETGYEEEFRGNEEPGVQERAAPM